MDSLFQTEPLLPRADEVPELGTWQELLLENLNTAQRQAVGHGMGPLLVVAGAGTGKTTTLAHRVAWLIAMGADPARMMLLTFTRRAAAEMMRRVDALLARLVASGLLPKMREGSLSGRRIFGGTFHAVGTRLLQQHGRAIGLGPEFTILDRSDAEDLMNQVRTELDLAKDTRRFPQKGTCIDIYSRCVNAQSPLAEVLKTSFPWCEEHAESLKKLFARYSEKKESQQILDYDDLLLFWSALVSDSVSGEMVRPRFDYVLVDEYQDTNAVQGEIVRGLAPEGQGLTVVGDDAQSIYSFRAATVRNILDFPQQFPGTTVVKLEQNYRSTQPLLEATNQVIALATEGHRKQLWSSKTEGSRPNLMTCLDESEQTDAVIAQILKNREESILLKQQAVLFRASHHSASLEVELSRRQIPFVKFGGLKFMEAAHVKDLLAFLRLAENPRDTVSAMRVLLLFPGIGPRKAQQLVSLLDEGSGDFEAWSAWPPIPAAKLHWPVFIALLRQLRRTDTDPLEVTTQVHHVRLFYAPLLELKHDHPQMRMRDLQQLEQLASRFTNRATFLAEITLDPPSSTQDLAADPFLDEDYVTLSTIHSAKGLEWEAVHVLHAADGNIPSDLATSSPEEIEEERRLFYVALTRAKRQLNIYHPQRYYFHHRRKSDQHSYSQLTRFLPPSLWPAFQRTTWKTPQEMNVENPTGAATTAEIRRRIGKMWD